MSRGQQHSLSGHKLNISQPPPTYGGLGAISSEMPARKTPALRCPCAASPPSAPVERVRLDLVLKVADHFAVPHSIVAGK